MSTQLIGDIATLEQQLNTAILNGQALQAFEDLYAENVVMQENSDEPFVGKAFNREREAQFFASIEAFHGAKLLASAVSGDHSFSEWWMDLTFKGAPRTQLSQVAVRQWQDGKVVHERFYHKG